MTRPPRPALGAVAAALAVAALPVAPAQAVDREVPAGSLRAVVAPGDGWHVDWVQPRGGPVLAQARGASGGPTGTLGFATGGGWWHATRIVSESRQGPAYVAELETTDPLGRRLLVRIQPEAEGVVGLQAAVSGATGDVTLTGIAFDAPAGERHLGFGERSNAVDQRGNTVENFVADGPYQPEERGPITAFVPAHGFGGRDDSTYFPTPWLLSSRGYGVLVDNHENSYFRLGTDRPGAWSLEVQSSRLVLRVFAGPRPADVLRRFTGLVGRQPPAAAPFYFGPWFQPKGSDDENLRALRRADAPASVVQTYTHYLPCGDHVARRGAERQRVAKLHAEGMAVTTYFNPMICTSDQPAYDRARAAGVLHRNQLDQPYEYRYTGSSVFLVGQFDFSHPGTERFYGDLLQEAIDDGHDGWMEDFGEYTPPDAKSANGMPGPAMHNLDPTLYHAAARAFAVRRSPRPLARFNRSGWTGAPRHSQIVWGGDPSTNWDFDGLESAVKQALSIGLSGVSLWGSDIGGFFSLWEPQLDEELLIRWLQFGAASGVMRTQANGFDLVPSDRAQIFDRQVLPHWRRYAKLRTQLYPYLDAAEAIYDRTGLPLMRHLALVFHNDARSLDPEDQYMLGPHLLVAPVMRPGQRSRRVYLPPGPWIDFWRAVHLRARDGGLELGRAGITTGGGDATLPAPLGELPMLIRAGAVLPLLSADVWTLADYGDPRRVVRLRDRRDRMRLLAFPHGASTSAISPTEDVRMRERPGRLILDVRGSRTRSYELELSLATLKRRLRPCAVLLNGRRLRGRAWRHYPARGVLHVRFRVRRATLTVRGACPRRR